MTRRLRLFLAMSLATLAHEAIGSPPAPGSEDGQIMAPYQTWITTRSDRHNNACCDIGDGRPVEADMVTMIDEDDVRRTHWRAHVTPKSLPGPAGSLGRGAGREDRARRQSDRQSYPVAVQRPGAVLRPSGGTLAATGTAACSSRLVRAACRRRCLRRWPGSAGPCRGGDGVPNYSGTTSPEPPNSAGKSFSFGSPSRIGSTVSA